MEGANILIIDDDEMNRDICALNLESVNATLHFAADGKEGLHLAREKNPDLILLDIMMPEMDGMTLLHIIRTEATLAHIPILMLTAKSETSDIVKALRLGANDYLKKPFAEEEMVARVNTLLSNRLLEKRLTEDLKAGAILQRKFFTNAVEAKRICNGYGMHIEIFNKAYAGISGDFFYCYPITEKAFAIIVGDSCGHGLSAALISMRIISFFQKLAEDKNSNRNIMNMLNKDICGLLPKGKFVAVSTYIFQDNLVYFSNAGQPYPVLITDTDIVELDLDGFPLGLDQDYEYREISFSLTANNKLIIYTDGIIEIANNNMHSGKKKFIKSLQEINYHSTLENFSERVRNNIPFLSDSTLPEDDQTLIILEKV